MELSERLDRLEASHVKLMTDHEVFVKDQERAWERNQKSWDRHDEWLREYKEREIERGERIDKLVSGIGEFMRRNVR